MDEIEESKSAEIQQRWGKNQEKMGVVGDFFVIVNSS